MSSSCRYLQDEIRDLIIVKHNLARKKTEIKKKKSHIGKPTPRNPKANAITHAYE